MCGVLGGRSRLLLVWLPHSLKLHAHTNLLMHTGTCEPTRTRTLNALLKAHPLPRRSYVKSVDSFFLWQNIGGALLTLAPTVTYTLKARARGCCTALLCGVVLCCGGGWGVGLCER